MARRQAHLMPLGERRQPRLRTREPRAVAVAPEVRPATGELTELEERFQMRQELASATVRVKAIVDASEPASRQDGYMMEVGRNRMKAVLDVHERQNRRVNETLSELSEWQDTFADSAFVDTCEAEADAMELADLMEGGYKHFQGIDEAQERRVELVERVRAHAKDLGAAEKVNEEERQRQMHALASKKKKANQQKKRTTKTTTNNTNNNGGEVNGASERIMSHFERLDEMEQLREQAAKATENATQAELEAQAMAHQKREAESTLSAVREEYEFEMDKLSKLVATLENRDRMVNLEWRDASEIIGGGPRATNPEVAKLELELEALKEALQDESRKHAAVDQRLRVSQSINAELEDDLRIARDRLQKGVSVGLSDRRVHDEDRRAGNDETLERALESGDIDALVDLKDRQATEGKNWEATRALAKKIKEATAKNNAANADLIRSLRAQVDKKTSAKDDGSSLTQKEQSNIMKEDDNTTEAEASALKSSESSDTTTTTTTEQLLEAARRDLAEAREETLRATAAKDDLAEQLADHMKQVADLLAEKKGTPEGRLEKGRLENLREDLADLAKRKEADMRTMADQAKAHEDQKERCAEELEALEAERAKRQDEISRAATERERLEKLIAEAKAKRSARPRPSFNTTTEEKISPEETTPAVSADDLEKILERACRANDDDDHFFPSSEKNAPPSREDLLSYVLAKTLKGAYSPPTADEGKTVVFETAAEATAYVDRRLGVLAANYDGDDRMARLEGHVAQLKSDLDATKDEKVQLAIENSAQKRDIAELQACLAKMTTVLREVQDASDGARTTADAGLSVTGAAVSQRAKMDAVLNFAELLQANVKKHRHTISQAPAPAPDNMHHPTDRQPRRSARESAKIGGLALRAKMLGKAFAKPPPHEALPMKSMFIRTLSARQPRLSGRRSWRTAKVPAGIIVQKEKSDDAAARAEGWSLLAAQEARNNASPRQEAEGPAAAPDSIASDSIAADSIAQESIAADSTAQESIAPDAIAPDAIATNDSAAPYSKATPDSAAPPRPDLHMLARRKVKAIMFMANHMRQSKPAAAEVQQTNEMSASAPVADEAVAVKEGLAEPSMKKIGALPRALMAVQRRLKAFRDRTSSVCSTASVATREAAAEKKTHEGRVIDNYLTVVDDALSKLADTAGELQRNQQLSDLTKQYLTSHVERLNAAIESGDWRGIEHVLSELLPTDELAGSSLSPFDSLVIKSRVVLDHLMKDLQALTTFPSDMGIDIAVKQASSALTDLLAAARDHGKALASPQQQQQQHQQQQQQQHQQQQPQHQQQQQYQSQSLAEQQEQANIYAIVLQRRIQDLTQNNTRLETALAKLKRESRRATAAGSRKNESDSRSKACTESLSWEQRASGSQSPLSRPASSASFGSEHESVHSVASGKTDEKPAFVERTFIVRSRTPVDARGDSQGGKSVNQQPTSENHHHQLESEEHHEPSRKPMKQQPTHENDHRQLESEEHHEPSPNEAKTVPRDKNKGAPPREEEQQQPPPKEKQQELAEGEEAVPFEQGITEVEAFPQQPSRRRSSSYWVASLDGLETTSGGQKKEAALPAVTLAAIRRSSKGSRRGSRRGSASSIARGSVSSSARGSVSSIARGSESSIARGSVSSSARGSVSASALGSLRGFDQPSDSLTEQSRFAGGLPPLQQDETKDNEDDRLLAEAARSVFAAGDDSDEDDEDNEDDFVVIPEVEADDVFERNFMGALEEYSDDVMAVAAVARTLGRLLVLQDKLKSLSDDLEEIGDLDVIEDETAMEAMRMRRAVVSARSDMLRQCVGDVSAALSEFDLDALVTTRHEVQALARKARAMAGWVLTLGRKGPGQEIAYYGRAVDGLSLGIDKLGGWRAYVTLSDGSINEEADASLWPHNEAVQILERLVQHYAELHGNEKDTTTRLHRTIGQLKSRMAVLESNLQAARAAPKVEPENLEAAEEGEDPAEGAALKNSDDMAGEWQEERAVVARLGVEIANTCQFALNSSLAKACGFENPTEASSKRGPPLPKPAPPEKEAPLQSDSSENLPPHGSAAQTPSPTNAAGRPATSAGVLHTVHVDVEKMVVEKPAPPVAATEKRRMSTAEGASYAVAPRALSPPAKVTAILPASVRLARQLFVRVKKLNERIHGTDPGSEQARVREAVRDLKRFVMKVLGSVSADFAQLRQFIKLVVERDEKNASDADLREREIDILVRGQMAMRKSVRVMEAVYDKAGATTSDVVHNLRHELALAQDRLARSDSALLVLQQTCGAADASRGMGRLELLEDMMRRHAQVSEIHAALLPKYDAVEAELLSVVAKLKNLQHSKHHHHNTHSPRGQQGDDAEQPEQLRLLQRSKEELSRRSLQLKRKKDELELRLYSAFREVEEVEKLMIQLYERVEAATQYVFSGESYRGMLIWAADKEAHYSTNPPSPRLAAAARALAAPARGLLQTAGTADLTKEALRRQELRKNNNVRPSSTRLAPTLPNPLKYPTARELVAQYGNLMAQREFSNVPKLRPVRANFLSTHARTTFHD